MYHCSQVDKRQHKPKKGKRDGALLRDKEAMSSYQCMGWLHITLMEDTDMAFVKLKHEDDHVPYWKIDVPEEVQEFVLDNLQLTTAKVSMSSAILFLTIDVIM